MEQTNIFGSISNFYRFVAERFEDFPTRVKEGIKFFLGYDAAYIIYMKRPSGEYVPVECYGDKSYEQVFESFSTQYAKNDVFVNNIDTMLHSIARKKLKHVWRIQDFQSMETFQESDYYQKAMNIYGVGYRAWITFKQPWDKLQHTVVIFKPKEDGDFTDEEMTMLNLVAIILEAAMKIYHEKVENEMLKALLACSSIGGGREICVLNCRHKVIFTTEHFDSIKREVMPDDTVWSMAQSVLDGIDYMAVTQKEVFSRLVIANGSRFMVEVRPFWLNTDIVRKTQHLILVAISRANKERRHEGASAENKSYIKAFDAFGLTRRELDTLRLLMAGISTKAIAEELFISVTTVRTHLGSLFRKLGVHTQAEAVARIAELYEAD